MFHRDPILIRAPLGRIYSFTRYYRGDDFFDGPRLAFPHDRGYARERLIALTRHLGNDPFNYRLLDVWQLVFQKPWTRPASLHQLVMDLTDKITRGELFVYLEPNLERDYRALISDGPSAGAANPDDSVPLADIPRVAGPLAAKSPGWAFDYASGLGGVVSTMASDFSAEQSDLYDSSSGWGNIMYPVFKPIEDAGRFVGNTVGLLSGLSPNGMNPDVAEYWSSMGEGLQALGSRVVDAVKGDGRAAGEITPTLASMAFSKKMPGKRPTDQLDRLRAEGHALQRHGGDVTDEQLYVRAQTGIAPDGSKTRRGYTPISTAFNSDELLVQADDILRSTHLNNAVKNAGPGAVRVKVSADTGIEMGRGYIPVGRKIGLSGPLQKVDNLTNVEAWYVLDPAKNSWQTNTIYPIPSR